ncbi:hypothetical protein D3C71_1888110 [compost metagenome]
MPLGEFADRAVEFVNSSPVDVVRRWKDANTQPLQTFWSKSPADALALKKIIEKKLAEQPSKTGAAA